MATDETLPEMSERMADDDHWGPQGDLSPRSFSARPPMSGDDDPEAPPSPPDPMFMPPPPLPQSFDEMAVRLVEMEMKAATVPDELRSVVGPNANDVAPLVLYLDVNGQTTYWAPIGDHDKIFDLYDITSTTVKVRGTTDDKLVCIVGVWTAITGGTHELDASITISANAYIYVTVKRNTAGASTAKLESGATLPNGDEDEEHYPLWYIPFADSVITAQDIIDMRGTIHVTAFG